MILDALLQFTGGSGGVGNNDGATDSPTTGSQTSSNIIDLGGPGLPVLASGQGARDLGIGDRPAMKLLAQVTTTFTGGTSMVVTLQGSVDNGSGAPAGFTSWWASPVYSEAQLIVGARLFDMDMPRPPAAVAYPRFLQFAYTTVGTHGAGKIRMALVIDRHDQVMQGTNEGVLGSYPAGINIAN